MYLYTRRICHPSPCPPWFFLHGHATPTDDDLHNHPHVFLTANSPWNPDNVDEEFHHDVLTDTLLTEDPLLQSLKNAHDHHIDAYGGIHLHFLDTLQDESTPSDDLFF